MANRPKWSISPLGLFPGWLIAWLFSLWFSSAGPWGLFLSGLATAVAFSLLYYCAAKWGDKSQGEFFRGIIIGFSAGLNAYLLWWITGWGMFSLAIGAILSASTVLRLSRSRRYQFLLGWVNWILPLSLPVNLPGILMVLTNLLFLPVAYLHPLFRPMLMRVELDLNSGSLTCYGGLVRPFPGFSGLNMGNLIFINPGFEHLKRHEIGHLFSLAALGSVFHYVGGIDEAMFQKNYWEAYAEHLADSYSNPTPLVHSIWG